MAAYTEQETAESTPQGLCSAEVAERVARGEVNRTNEKCGKSYARIVSDNLLTFFNIVWALIAVLMIAIGSFSNLTFLCVVIPNVLIAIIQECRAKATVEKLSVTTDPKAVVIRDGVATEIPADQIVMDDVMVVRMGQQILSDAEVIGGLAEANESMLTGESNPIRKAEGDRVLAGSFLVSGTIYARVNAVGRDNYVHKIEKAAKGYKPPASNLFRDLNRLLRWVAIFMIPMAIAMFFSNRAAAGGDLHTAILQTAGSVIGMIPAGMYLLVTVTLTLSVITLAKKQTLIQDMYSIEMLASADVICLDKTGTITDGTMCVSDFELLGSTAEDEARRAIALLEGAEPAVNATARALVEAFGTSTDASITERVPFSSARKYSAIEIDGKESYSIGAPHFVRCPVSDALEARIGEYAAQGKRVLLVARHAALGESGEAIALIAVTDRIRPNAAETIQNFQSQGVTVKIISGDHAATVSSIAARVGVAHAEKYISCESLADAELEAAAEEYAVFGRVTPEQKVLLVRRLRALGHTVAMTGDGVNDTLALKESNCSIAMADGSEMAHKVSQIVLLNSDFGTLPDVVREGRRCINNVRRSSTLFLMKTVLTILLSLYTVCTITLYPFQPKSTMLLELFVIGAASVLLAIEPNNNRIQGSFIKTVLIQSLPSAIALFLSVLPLLVLPTIPHVTNDEMRNTLAMIAMTCSGFVNLVLLCIPYTKWRAIVVASMGALIALAVPVTVFLMNDMLGLLQIAAIPGVVAAVIGVAIVSTVLINLAASFAIHMIRKKRRA